ncbi:cysteine synthase family protein [Methylobacterium sp. J-072]|uniref:PLP-dependent cysteine synthase family protein n=1 Tax=Methylobacterium sp. J-072 TaxID=2836651 RepID=UPI001FB9DA25|nr:cysteine synthase family protein [Methylobacterium sp. J-072]MCJ2091158.1 cysteine synthase family protein [Methylobacterium sp. J-072]
MTAWSDHLAALIGNTPLLELKRFGGRQTNPCRILAKIEYLNPAGSIKDRTAWGIIRAAEADGHLRPGQTLVDLTSGNTGIGLAALAAARGYRAKFYLRASTSPEKIALIHQYGARTILIDDAEFLQPGAVDLIIDRVRQENPDAFYTNQRGNPANPRIHFETTGPEIWRDTAGAVDILVSAVGAGGTVSGTGRYLKAQKPGLKVVVVEPAAGSVPTPDHPDVDTVEGVHKVTEVEAQHLPGNYDSGVVDAVIACETAQARLTARALARDEGLTAGPSSGAVLFAAAQLAARPENAGRTIVAIIADSGERYLSLPGVEGDRTPQPDPAPGLQRRSGAWSSPAVRTGPKPSYYGPLG